MWRIMDRINTLDTLIDTLEIMRCNKYIRDNK